MYGFDSAWVDVRRRDAVTRVGLDGKTIATAKLMGGFAFGVGAGPDAMWATTGPHPDAGCDRAESVSFVVRIDPATTTANGRTPVACAFAVAATADAVWVVGSELQRIEPAP
ncbi:MAG TPA: hypothetical protein VGP30_01020 [Candidatus Limnocylindrales bacterium]|nr:hypothetical protein [Candidatus Limnocylindrales bacterium]